MRLPSEGIPYPLFSFAGISVWLLFVSVLQGATPSITRNAGIIRKMPTPRNVFPISGLTLSLTEFLFAMIPMAGLFVYFQWEVTWAVLYLIPIVIITALMAFSLGLLIASVSVFRNDLALILPFILQAGLFLSPILYPLSSVPEEYRALYSLNPMVGPLEGAHSALLRGEAPDWSLFLPAIAIIVVFLPLSTYVYHRMSRYFADFF
jgi:lipopolysaccharide transport system permease protein